MQNYVKLYFKKLLFMLLYVSLCLLIYFLGFSILVSIANIFENSMIRNCVLIGIPVGIIFTIVYCHRRDKSGIRRVYLEQLGHVKLSIKEELAYILHFPEFIAELLAFFTIILPVILAIGVASAAPWWARLRHIDRRRGFCWQISCAGTHRLHKHQYI